jgi:pSer/pThr/pTyr-binding forkhead associated (FHA) protein
MPAVVLHRRQGDRVAAADRFTVVDGLELTIGRDPAATVPFAPHENTWVSRQHACIRRVSEPATAFRLRDRNSQHGTYLNGHRIVGETAIVSGDVIRLGKGGPELLFEITLSPGERPDEGPELSGGCGSEAPARSVHI